MPGGAALLVPLGWASLPALVLLGCGVTAIAIAAAAMAPLARTIKSHRAVLAAYSLSVSKKGEVRAQPRVPAAAPPTRTSPSRRLQQ